MPVKILVTGAGGLIGGDAVRALALDDANVVAVSRGPMSIPQPSRVVMTTLDLRSLDSIRVLVAQAPELVVHAAAVLPNSLFGEQARNAAVQNRAIDKAVMSAAKSIGCRLIYLSGTSLYGCVQDICNEDSSVSPRGPYLEEKRRSEEKALGLPGGGMVLRVSSPYGVAQRAPTVLQKFVRQASLGEDLLYYGTGAREQDFIAVEDVSAAIVAAARGSRPGVFNIAGGRPIAMLDLATMVVQTLGSRQSRVRPAGIEDPEEGCRARIDIGRAAKELRWQPAMDLSTGIQRLASQWGKQEARGTSLGQR